MKTQGLRQSVNIEDATVIPWYEQWYQSSNPVQSAIGGTAGGYDLLFAQLKSMLNPPIATMATDIPNPFLGNRSVDQSMDAARASILSSIDKLMKAGK